MYSVVLMAAMTSGGEVADFGKRGGFFLGRRGGDCCGCCGTVAPPPVCPQPVPAVAPPAPVTQNRAPAPVAQAPAPTAQAPTPNVRTANTGGGNRQPTPNM